jgi:hypothetical protein
VTTAFLITCLIIGLLLAAGGLFFAVRAGWRLYKTVRDVERQMTAEVNIVLRKQDEVLARMAGIEAGQRELLEQLETTKASTARLGLLLSELSEARSRLLRIP